MKKFFSGGVFNELKYGLLVLIYVSMCFLVFGSLFAVGISFGSERPEIDLTSLEKNTTAERKVDSRNLKMEVYPTPRDVTNETKHMSPPNLTHKLYCINGYLYVMVFVSYGWDPKTGSAEKVETHFIQQFDRQGKGVMCK